MTIIAPFITTLALILDEEDDSIIRWSNEGTYVQIVNQRELEAKVLLKYFRHKKYASFQRQLNYFGFRKQNGCRAVISNYYHKHFSHHRRDCWYLIRRKMSQPILTLPKPPEMFKDVEMLTPFQVEFHASHYAPLHQDDTIDWNFIHELLSN